LHGLLDTIADGYFAVAQQLDDAVEALEDETFAGPGDIRRRRQGFGLRKQLTRLRRLAAPTRELVAALERSGDGVVDDALRPYFRDVYDHAARVADWTEDLRDLVDSVLAFNLDEQSYSLNEVTKKLAAWAAIIAVPTAVTGFYGQNVPYPGFGHHGGFVTSSLVIVLLSGGLYILLRRRDWL
jgi:magnesium transporter